VTGILRLAPGDAPYRVDRLRVSVRDVTELGGPAPTLAEVVLPGVDVPAGGRDVPFALDVELDPSRTYAVRAHADSGASGTVDTGDLVTTTTHVIGAATAAGVVVPLERVGR